jgi:hypothetical protein
MAGFNKDEIAHHLGSIDGKLDSFIHTLKNMESRITRNEQLCNTSKEEVQKEIAKLKLVQSKITIYLTGFLTLLTLALTSIMPQLIKKLFL